MGTECRSQHLPPKEDSLIINQDGNQSLQLHIHWHEKTQKAQRPITGWMGANELHWWIRFLLHRTDGQVCVRRMLGKEFMETCMQATVKPCGGGIRVWGCITAKDVRFLAKVDGDSYIRLPDSNCPKSFSAYWPGIPIRQYVVPFST